MTNTKNTGIDVPVPESKCEDNKCPFNGKIGLRGRSFVGKVVRITFKKNALIEFIRKRYIPKYERYETRRTRLWAHNPLCLGVVVGDEVKIMETRKLSKTKNFVIIQKL